MNTAEYRILRHLRENARSKLTTMSKKTKIPISTIFDKIRQLDGKLIKKFTVLLSFETMGLYSALMAVKVHPDEKQTLLEQLKADPKVNNLRRINNGFDFLVELVFSSMKELDEYLEMLDSTFRLKKKEIYYVLDDIKRETFLSEEFVTHDRLIDR